MSNATKNNTTEEPYELIFNDEGVCVAVKTTTLLMGTIINNFETGEMRVVEDSSDGFWASMFAKDKK